MWRKVSSPQDLIAGLLFIGIGGAAGLEAQDYQIGTATHMGPGYFPAGLGMVLVILGAFALVRGFRGPPESLPRGRLLPLVLILVGVFSFSMLIDRAGLVPAIFTLLLAACLPRVMSQPIELLLIFIVLATFSVGVFIYGLHMPFNAF